MKSANLAWALRVVPRSALPGPQETVSGSGDLTYLPITTPPDDRVPMPLMESDEGRWLVRGRLAGQQTDPVSQLLNKGFRLRDEELPDEGLTSSAATSSAEPPTAFSPGCRASSEPARGSP